MDAAPSPLTPWAVVHLRKGALISHSVLPLGLPSLILKSCLSVFVRLGLCLFWTGPAIPLLRAGVTGVYNPGAAPLATSLDTAGHV